MRFGLGVLKRRWFIAGAALLGVAAIAGAAMHTMWETGAAATEPLTAYAPQGSLMAVESPDFGALLGAWTKSAEEKAWVKSDNYAEFSNSRLFSRLGEAQSEFAASAGLDPNAQFLAQVAGQESLFAWYDIGKLEFLYVTRMKPGAAANNPLMKLVTKFQMRKAGSDSFYIRAQGGQVDAAGSQEAGAEVGTGAATVRTVAFAVHGDLLLLATREDLIANALLLAQHQGDANLKDEAWYSAAGSAAEAGKGGARPDLRMTLNLAKIVPSPYFRSYWVQKNVTEMRQYSAAVSDLYRGPEGFREERVLIPKSPEMESVTSDVGALLNYLPDNSGVYEAKVRPSTAEMVDELDRRLISRSAAAYRNVRIAPVADVSEASAGSSADLDTRIDEEAVPEQPMAVSLEGLRGVIASEHPDAMLVYSSGANPETDAVFGPMHTAVMLAAGTSWDAIAVENALSAALRERLTVGGKGLNWQAKEQDGESWMQLSGLQPLAMAARGGTLVVASDSETMLQVLRSSRKSGREAARVGGVKRVAGFSHTAERARYLRLTGLLDRDHAVQGGGNASTVTSSPAIFSKNLGGLSETFKALDSETFLERAGPNGVVRQTVVYRWLK